MIVLGFVLLALGLACLALIKAAARRVAGERAPEPVPVYVGGRAEVREAEARGEKVVSVGLRTVAAVNAGVLEVEQLHAMNRAQRRAVERNLRRPAR